MVLKLLGTIGVPGTFSGKMYSIEGLRYWPQVRPFAAVGATVTMQGLNASPAQLHFDRHLTVTPTFTIGPDMMTSFTWKKY